MISKILVATDFSDGSRAALDEAIVLAKTFGATIDLIHAWEAPLYVGADMVVIGAGEMRATIADYVRRSASEELEHWIADLRGKGFPTAQGILVMAEASSAVVDHAPQYDMLVVGTHGRTGIRRFVLGSIAEKIVRSSPTPVLTVHASPAGAKAEART